MPIALAEILAPMLSLIVAGMVTPLIGALAMSASSTVGIGNSLRLGSRAQPDGRSTATVATGAVPA